jgi:hypothetical protein
MTRLGHGRYRLKVTSSVAGVGANEAAVDTRPVRHATIQLGHAKTFTNSAGVAVVRLKRSRKVTATAGDTLVPTSVRLAGSDGQPRGRNFS